MTKLGGNRNWQAMPTGNAKGGILPESNLIARVRAVWMRR